MGADRENRTSVARHVVLDGRLALFHKQQRWLAVADLHFGYEVSQRASGNLFPLWGIQTIEARLHELLSDYKPKHLLLLGDLVHDRAGAAALGVLLKELRQACEVIAIAGNHDRRLGRGIDLVDLWHSDGFCFHHGHCASDLDDRVQVIGHHHPAATMRDGAGLRLKLPAFVQQEKCWIMPAFSPWAAGAEWSPNETDRVWLCTPQRVLPLPAAGPQ